MVTRAGLKSGGAALLGVLCLGAGPPVAPVAGEVALEYRLGEGAASCPGEQVFRERAADLFDLYDPFVRDGQAATSRLRIEITGGPKGFHGALLVLDFGDGKTLASSAEREESCDLLVWTLAHRMAMAIINPRRVAANRTTDDKEIRRRLDALEERAEDQDARLQARNKRITELARALEKAKKKMDLTYVLSAGALITANLTSNAGPGLWLGGEARSGPLALGLELRGVLPAQVRVGGPYDFDLSQVTVLLTPCGHHSVFFGCAVAGIGAQIMHDSNFPDSPKTDAVHLLQIGARLGVEVPFGDSMFGARSWAELLYSAPPTQVNYLAPGLSSRRPDVSVFIGLGLVVRFGEAGAM